MKTLLQLLQEFDGTKASTKDKLTAEFKKIAERVLYGGHFEINDKTEIYPLEIEFYFYNEDLGRGNELNDSRMYHKGKKVPYFPVMSFYPHESGVDVTFEKEPCRASFLIRRYRYVYHNPEEEGTVENPRHLWEDMFGYHSISGDGINIRWVDTPDMPEVVIEQGKDRVNLNTEVDGHISKDTKPWRFSK